MNATIDRSEDRLFELLPLIYRMRDAGQGFPLRDFLRVLGRQADAIEADIARLYDNWFIETCDDWVVPYIGDLLGYSLLPEAATLGSAGDNAERLGRVLAPRADVANTIGARRRKGTLSLLEDLARDSADWPARAVEFYRLLGWMQHLDHQRPTRGGFADVRDPGATQSLQWRNGAFDPFAHTVDVRRLGSHRGRGRHGIPNVGLFVFRLRSDAVTKTPAYCVESSGAHCYSFSVLGNDSPLYRKPVAETEKTGIAEEANLPVPLRRYRFAEHGGRADDKAARYATVAADLYGEGRSFTIYAPDWPSRGQGLPVPRDMLLPADLDDWRYPAPRGKIAVDPERGRMVFPVNQRPKHGVWVSYRYGFAGDLGGGEYPRETAELENAYRHVVHAAQPGVDHARATWPQRHFGRISDALAAWAIEKDAVEAAALEACKAAGLEGPDALACAHAKRPRALILELAESGVYEGGVDLQLEPGEAIQIRAAEGARPVLRLLDLRASYPDAMTIAGKAGSRVLLDGLLIAGRGIEVQGPGDDSGNGAPGETAVDSPDGTHNGDAPIYSDNALGDDALDDSRRARGAGLPQDLCELTIRHCTLIPGWALHCDCDPKRPGEPSISLVGTRAALRVERSILGPISVVAPTPRGEPQRVSLCDSVLDATGAGRVALGSPDEVVAYVDAEIVRCTVVGEIQAHSMSLAEDSIFVDGVRVLRRQRGCMRFCHAPAGSRTPQRFRCQPDLAIATVPASDMAGRERERARVAPQFMTLRYGAPDYMRLADACAAEIRSGASDRSAMGVWHHLYEPQREANLAMRLEEHVPAGVDAGIIFAS